MLSNVLFPVPGLPTKILQHDGIYKIFFVMTLEAGRAKSDDVTTMRLILDAIKLAGVNFGIVVNKVTKNVLKIIENKSEMEKLKACINVDLPHKTDFFYFKAIDRDIEDEDNKVMVLDRNFMKFMDDMPPNIIRPENVEQVKHNEFEQIKIQMESAIEALKQDKKKNLQKRLNGIKNNLKMILREVKKTLKTNWHPLIKI